MTTFIQLKIDARKYILITKNNQFQMKIFNTIGGYKKSSSTNFLILLFFILYSIKVNATNIFVSSIAAMQTAINSANSGDTIILADGTYLNNNFSIATNNILVKTETTGGVVLNGTNSITISGNNISFLGFQFTSGTITGSAISITGNNNFLSQLNFNGYSAGHMLIISGQYNLISFCNFQNKLAPNLVNHGGTGDMVQIIPDPTVPGYNTISYCSFQHMPGFGGDYGNECIRIGDGAYSTFISRTLVEHCYFEDTGNGDSEAISVKSKENCLRYNTMNNNPNAMFSFRNGDDNVAYGNFFIASGGIRCKQANNIYCYNNYFGRSGIGQNSSLPGSGTSPVYLEYFGTGYGNNFNLIHNTFYRCTNSKIDTALNNCTWANNIFFSDSSTIFRGTTTGQMFVGNIYQGTLGLSITSGIINTDPLLTLNSNGYYGLSSTSPAIGASSSNYPPILNIAGINNDPTILMDIEGQGRPLNANSKDIGCDQFATGNITNQPLTVCDVGPTYLWPLYSCSSVSSTNDFFQNKADTTVFPNPFSQETKIEFMLSKPEHLYLIIYDGKGQSVRNLILGNLIQEGRCRISWDGMDDSGNQLPNGIYFYMIKNEDGKQKSGKIIRLN